MKKNKKKIIGGNDGFLWFIRNRRSLFRREMKLVKDFSGLYVQEGENKWYTSEEVDAEKLAIDLNIPYKEIKDEDS